jgi:hypothetical protein
VHYKLNNINPKTGAELVQLFKAIPIKVTTLDLSSSFQSDITHAELFQAFKTLPNKIKLTSLILKGIILGNINNADLIQILKAISPNLTSLDLGNNKLGNYTCPELVQTFKALPAKLTALNLEGNDLGSTTGGTLAQAFQELPKSLTSLNLSYTSLDNQIDGELGKVFQALPSNLTCLDLHGNDLNQFNSTELIAAFKSIQSTINIITLSNEDIATRSNEELARLGEALPYVKEIHLVDKDNHRIHQHEDEALDILNKYIGEKLKETQKKRSQTQPIRVDSMVQLLEKEANTTGTEFNSFSPKTTREKERTLLDIRILSIKEKAEELKTNAHENAYKVAIALHTTLTQLNDQYKDGTINYLKFNHDSKTAITKARPELEKHRGWKEILGNIALCILGLGLGYFALCAYRGCFFKFETDSAKKLNDLSHSIEAVSPDAF